LNKDSLSKGAKVLPDDQCFNPLLAVLDDCVVRCDRGARHKVHD